MLVAVKYENWYEVVGKRKMVAGEGRRQLSHKMSLMSDKMGLMGEKKRKICFYSSIEMVGLLL